MDEFVRDMHVRSGLMPLIAESSIDLEEAGRQTLEFIRRHVPEPSSVPLCGNSIGTDRRFLARWLPEIEQYLHTHSNTGQAVAFTVRIGQVQVAGKGLTGTLE